LVVAFSAENRCPLLRKMLRTEVVMACCVLTAAAIALVLAIKARLIGRPSDDVLAWRLRRMNDDGTE
jgi:hypothetical protein